MAWEQLAINKPHLAYLIIGGFTSLFMLCSLYVKEKLYIGEATVATLVGVIFGPHAANLFNPRSWGNVDQITLECSRIVLVVQCFAVGVELPKAYMERHWRSVVFLLVPVMTFGWLITSLFIWWMVEPLTWLESLACAACVTATDPVLASSVVGKGKFAKRVPKHLRDVLSAESGCNDGMAFPFIYLSLYLIKYRPHATEVAYHWICFTVLYECIFGAVFGFSIGYIGRHAIKWADRKGLIDRESFLVFYFVLALFCAGSGSLLGMDDLLIGFAAGVGFSNDGWFTQKTEESHVSNVIDLLLNLTYFVFLGAIVPWEQFNAPELGLTPWRLTVIAVLVILFRRIPIMLALKPLIPDVKNWREALFAGHFGPIGVGAIFAAILARAELENDLESTTPLAELPEPGAVNYLVVEVIWPITTFLVISSILVHGSSIAVFTLGKRINTLTLTMSYTRDNEEGQSWMNRLPRIASTSRTMSKGRSYDSRDDEKDDLPQFPPGTLPPVGLPGNFLRRQKEEDDPSNDNSRNSSLRPQRRKRWDSGLGPGGPISPSAIAPQRGRPLTLSQTPSTSDTLNEKENSSRNPGEDEEPDAIEIEEKVKRREQAERDDPNREEPTVEAYQEGNMLIVEDEEGNVLHEHDIHGESERQQKQHIKDDEAELERETSGQHAKGKFHPHEENEGKKIEEDVARALEHPSHPYQHMKKRIGHWNMWGKSRDDDGQPKQKSMPAHHRGPAHAYQYGNTIIVEDEDGEVVKKYDLPGQPKKTGQANDVPQYRRGLQRMGTWAGFAGKDAASSSSADAGQSTEVVQGSDGSNTAGFKEGSKKKQDPEEEEEDEKLRFTMTLGGHRMSKAEFIQRIQTLDPKARADMIEDSNVNDDVKSEARKHAIQHAAGKKQQQHAEQGSKSLLGNPLQRRSTAPQSPTEDAGNGHGDASPSTTDDEHGGHTLQNSTSADVPTHSVKDTISRRTSGLPESAAARRRRQATMHKDSDNDGTARIPPSTSLASSSRSPPAGTPESKRRAAMLGLGEDERETVAERRRRLAALGEEDDTAAARNDTAAVGKGRQVDDDSDDDGGERNTHARGRRPVEEPGNENAAGSSGGAGSGSGAAAGTTGTQQQQTGATTPRLGIRFADAPATSMDRRIQWGDDVKKLKR
ncbi:hypothetical protein MMC25_003736 [Agyrium rufum]|nr:hypothetical protein [Agyrium rufum]